MIFRSFDGRLIMPIHQPNIGPIRMHLFELEDLGDKLRIKAEITMIDNPAAVGKTVEVVEGLAEGAFAAVINGDTARHDSLILDAARCVSDCVDVLVLAQGSMARMEKTLADETGKPVLSSPLSGALEVKDRLSQVCEKGATGEGCAFLMRKDQDE